MDAYLDELLAQFPKEAPYEIPILDINKQLTRIENPMLWGDQPRKNPHEGMYLFYVDDYKFYNLIKRPLKLVKSGCYGAVEANFSTNPEMVRAVSLYYLFQKRFLSRIWQYYGVDIAVDMCWNPKFYDIALIGVPKGWKSYATRGYREVVDGIDEEYELACNHAETDDITFIVYGGGKQVKERADQKGWIHIEEKMDRVRRNATNA